MSDITTVWDSSQCSGDWELSGAQLRTGDDLATAIYISLFTDRAAGPDDVILDGSGDPRGWVGDIGQDHQIGSRLWLLERAKQTNETLAKAKDYVEEAIQWFVDDGVVAKFGILVEWTRSGMLGISITAYKRDGSKAVVKYEWAWRGVA